MMPGAHVRLSAGREAMSDELQALCFMAGANSMFYGEKLLTTGNPDVARDQNLFARLGLKTEAATRPRAGCADVGHRHAHDACAAHQRQRIRAYLTPSPTIHQRVTRLPIERRVVKREPQRAESRPLGSRSSAPEATALHRPGLSGCRTSRAEVVVEGKRLVDFCSNDYLGLARHPQIAERMCEAARRTGVRQRRRASRHRPWHRARGPRRRARRFYAAGNARCCSPPATWRISPAICTLADRGEVVLLDRLNHASLIDGALLVRRSVQPLCARRWQRRRKVAHRAQRRSVGARYGWRVQHGWRCRPPAVDCPRLRTRRRPG